jgi:hypothetical protein|tara:strand:+ start:675 stop:878 length:204 start_codon:yes stop_codon:yes gene_type:complete
MNRTAKVNFQVYNNPGMSSTVVKEVTISNELYSKAQLSGSPNDSELSNWAKQFFLNAYEVKVQGIAY